MKTIATELNIRRADKRGHDMDHYATDVSAVVSHLGLRDAIHIGHSTGGGEALHYVARHGRGRVATLVLVGAVPPIMLKTAGNPDGMPIEVFDGFRSQLAANRAQSRCRSESLGAASPDSFATITGNPNTFP